MEVVAPADVTAAPFALCPRFDMLAVGMASSPAPRGDAEGTGASRVDVLRLLRPTGDLDLEGPLQFDCYQPSPGLRRVAWSSTPTKGPDDKLTPVEADLYPAGLLAGGFNDGAVRIWNPASTMRCDLDKSSARAKPKSALFLDKESVIAGNTESVIFTTVSEMYSDIRQDNICWTCGEDYFHTKEQERTDGQLVDNDAESLGWEVIGKDESVAKTMELVTETRCQHGPVLGLSFNNLYPYWIGIGAGKSISVHDLHYPLQLSKKKCELSDKASKTNTQVTCLKWSKISPCILASSGDAGITKIWDIRKAAGQSLTTLAASDKICTSDLEFSWNNPMHLAVSSKASAAIKIWDIRHQWVPFHQYTSGDSGVLSLSWNRLGQLLASNVTGGISCYDVYKEKMVQNNGLPLCDLGITWTHSENVAALLSSSKKIGVKLCQIGG